MSIADRIAELLTQQGAITAQGLQNTGLLRAQGIQNAANINAAAQLQSGNAWAQAIQALSQIPGQAFSQYQQAKQADLQDQAQKQRIAANALELDQAQRQAQGNKILAAQMQATGQPLPAGQQGPVEPSYLDSNGLLDPQKVTHALASGGYGDLVPSVLSKVDTINDSVLKHQDLQTKFENQHTVMLGDMASGAYALWKKGVPIDQAMDIVSAPGIANQRFDPTEYAQIKQKIMNLTPDQQEAAFNAMIDAGDKASPLKEVPEGGKLFTRSGRVSAENPKPTPPQKTRVVTITHADGSTTQEIVADTPGQQFESARKPSDVQRVAIDIPGVGTNLMGEYHPSPTGGTVTYNGKDVTGNFKLHERPVVSQQTGQSAIPEIKPDSREYRIAKDIASGALSMADFNRIYGRAAGNANMKAAIYDTARQLNPDFNPTQFELGQRMAGNPAIRQRIVAINALEPVIAQVDKLADQVGNGDVPAWNKLLNTAKFNIGDKTVTNFRQMQILLGDEVGNALGVGSGSDLKTKLGIDLVNPNLSAANFKATMDQLRGVLTARRVELQRTMGPYGGVAAPTGTRRVQGPNGQMGTVPDDGATLPSGWTVIP